MLFRTAIFALTLLCPLAALAQDTVELSETQRSYNEKGVSAIRDGNFALAISSFEASLTLGEANVIYLNIGRAYQRAGDCMNAKTAYAQVEAAPAVAAPSRDEILKVLEKYAGELPEVCPATVRVICDSPQATASVDGGETQSCSPNADFEVVPGERRVTAQAGDKSIERAVSPAEGETIEVAITFPVDEPDPTPDPTPPDVDQPDTTPDPGLVVEAPPRRSPLRTVGLVTGAVGAAALTVGFINDVTWVKSAVDRCLADEREFCPSDDHQKAQRVRTINGVIFATGGGLAIGGLILYLAGGSGEGGVGLQFMGGPGIAWTSRF